MFAVLTALSIAIMVLHMRTTVTIDPDTDALLREEVARTGSSFKVVLNESIRRALSRPAKAVAVEPLFSAPFPNTLDGKSFNHLSSEWDDEDTLREMSS